MDQDNTYKQISGKMLWRLIKEKNLTGVVVFSADWMGGSAVLHLMMENYAASEYALPNARLYHINSDEERAVSDELGVNGHLTTLFFKNGAIVGKQDGIMSKSFLKNKIEHLLQESFSHIEIE